MYVIVCWRRVDEFISFIAPGLKSTDRNLDQNFAISAPSYQIEAVKISGSAQRSCCSMRRRLPMSWETVVEILTIVFREKPHNIGNYSRPCIRDMR